MDLPLYILRLKLADYKGGDDPLLIYLAAGLLIALCLSGFVWLCWQAYKQWKLQRLCQQLGFSGDELGLLKGFMRRLHVKKRLETVTQQRQFDLFVNRVAHHYSNRPLTEEALIRDIDTFGNIRLKLDLKHHFRQPKINSSRALPLKYPLDIIYTDDETKETFRMQSKVIANNEFYLGVIPPDSEIAKGLPHAKNPRLQVAFQRERGALYSFDSRFVRLVNHPQTMWYISHGDTLRKSRQATQLQIPGNLIVCGDEDECSVQYELNGSISVLDLEYCLVELEGEVHPVQKGVYTLLTFDMEGEPMTLRGHVAQTHANNGKLSIRIDFSNLSTEETQLLIRYRNQKKKERKKVKA